MKDGDAKSVMAQMLRQVHAHADSKNTGPRPVGQPDREHDIHQVLDDMEAQSSRDIDSLGKKNGRIE